MSAWPCVNCKDRRLDDLVDAHHLGCDAECGHEPFQVHRRCLDSWMVAE